LIGNGIAAFQAVVDRQGDRLRITIVALIANAVLGIALIPPLGLAGAVLTYAGTRLTELGLAIVYLRRATTGGLPWAPMARLFGVGSVATAAAWALIAWLPSRYGFIGGGLLFVALYVPASVLVRYWSVDDYRLMTSITDRMGPPGRLLMRGLQLLKGPHGVGP
jgi:peptidoglycan biosynthesis protein MviN/MurJ (putative lipid II flippase)